MYHAREEIEKITKLIKEESITMKHIGIQNIAKRMTLMFPNSSGLIIKSEQGTCIGMYFPLIKNK